MIPAFHKDRAADASPGDLTPGLAVMHAVIHRAAVATATASIEAAEQRRAQLVLEMACHKNQLETWMNSWLIMVNDG